MTDQGELTHALTVRAGAVALGGFASGLTDGAKTPAREPRAPTVTGMSDHWKPLPDEHADPLGFDVDDELAAVAQDAEIVGETPVNAALGRGSDTEQPGRLGRRALLALSAFAAAGVAAMVLAHTGSTPPSTPAQPPAATQTATPDAPARTGHKRKPSGSGVVVNPRKKVKPHAKTGARSQVKIPDVGKTSKPREVKIPDVGKTSEPREVKIPDVGKTDTSDHKINFPDVGGNG